MFNLFLNDLKKDLYEHGVRGIDVNNTTKLNCILYADDTVILSESYRLAKIAIKVLESYCTVNGLSVNTAKTKIMVFRAGGKLKSDLKFEFKGAPIEVVSQYNYLGVMFSSSNKFYKELKQAQNKAYFVLCSARAVMVRAKIQSWDARQKIFDATVLSTLLYGCETWGLRYLEEIEKTQNVYYKSIYNWPVTTPGYIIRLETGVAPLSSLVLL